MNKNKKIVLMVIGIVILIGVFFGGVSYGKSKKSNRGPEDMQAFGQNDETGTRGMKTGGGFGGLTAGEIISKDDKSITIKLQDNGSKIIFLGTSTTVAKTVTGSISDLSVGASVSITGTANTDGSVNAQSIQIRPNTPTVLK